MLTTSLEEEDVLSTRPSSQKVPNDPHPPHRHAQDISPPERGLPKPQPSAPSSPHRRPPCSCSCSRTCHSSCASTRAGRGMKRRVQDLREPERVGDKEDEGKNVAKEGGLLKEEEEHEEEEERWVGR
jgi:hypothetical protein